MQGLGQDYPQTSQTTQIPEVIDTRQSALGNARATAGQSTRTGSARFDAALSSALAAKLKARLAGAMSLPLNAPLKLRLTARLKARFCPRLAFGLNPSM